MSTVHKNIEIQAGATFTMEITHLQSDGVTAQPASGVSIARMQARKTKSATVPHLDLDSGAKGGISVADGLLTVTVSAADATTLYSNMTQGVYDIEVDYTDGTTERIAEGAIEIDDQVTS